MLANLKSLDIKLTTNDQIKPLSTIDRDCLIY